MRPTISAGSHAQGMCTKFFDTELQLSEACGIQYIEAVLPNAKVYFLFDTYRPPERNKKR